MGDPKTVEVVTDALRLEATMWDEQSTKLGTISSAAAGLDMSYLQAGMFAIMVSAYGDAREQIQSRTSEGKTRTAEIADALRLNANAYDQADAEVTETVEGTY